MAVIEGRWYGTIAAGNYSPRTDCKRRESGGRVDLWRFWSASYLPIALFRDRGECNWRSVIISSKKIITSSSICYVNVVRVIENKEILDVRCEETNNPKAGVKSQALSSAPTTPTSTPLSSIATYYYW